MSMEKTAHLPGRSSPIPNSVKFLYCFVLFGILFPIKGISQSLSSLQPCFHSNVTVWSFSTSIFLKKFTLKLRVATLWALHS